MLGPTALEQVYYYIKRNSISLDTFLTSIQASRANNQGFTVLNFPS